MNTQPSRKDLLLSLQMIREMCDQMERKVKDIAPEKEWLNTKEFARRDGVTLKTISNYCVSGKYGQNQRKNKKGRWLIHKSELAQ